MLIYVDDACLYRYLQFSGIAIAVAHEITHGFDDEGYSSMFVFCRYPHLIKMSGIGQC